MKSFVDYLTESEKTYSFKIGIAGEVPEGFEDRLEQSLQKYALKNLSSGKRTPIQEHPLDFPQLQNTEVTYYDVELTYPTTPPVLEEYISQCSMLHRANVKVIDPHTQRIMDDQMANMENDTYETMLGSDYKDPVSSAESQKMAGENRVMDLLKELETARKERQNNPTDGVHVGDSKDIDNAENEKSTIGS